MWSLSKQINTIIVLFSVPAFAPCTQASLEQLTKNQLKQHADLLSMPFRDFICITAEQKKKKAYIAALPQRPEFLNIDWDVDSMGDGGKLARQLWKLQSNVQDRSFHRSLHAVLKTIMEMHCVPDAIIERVQDIITMWVAERAKRLSKGRKPKIEASEEVIMERRRRANLRNQRRTAMRREGLCWSLLEYLEIANPYKADPREIHAEALKYRDKYPSSKSFIKSLRNCFSELGHDEKDVCDYTLHPDNYSHPQWNPYSDDQGMSVPAPALEEHLHLPEQGISDRKHNDSWNYLAKENLYSMDPETNAFNVGTDADTTCCSSLEPLGIGQDSSSHEASNRFDFTDDDDFFVPPFRKDVDITLDGDVIFPDWDEFL